MLIVLCKVCAASEFAGVPPEFVKESILPKDSDLCLMIGSKKPGKEQYLLLKSGV